MRPARSILTLLLNASVFLAVPFPAASRKEQPQDQTGILRVNTRLVLVDVVVTDKGGLAVENLNENDFRLLENGKPQKISVFSLERPIHRPRPGLIPIPPHVYTNRPEYRLSSGVPTVLLLDALNTEVSDQVYARAQLKEAVLREFQPGQPIAIYVLGDSLKVLQDFTADPQLLEAGLDSFVPEKSHLWDLANVEGNMPPTPTETGSRRPYSDTQIAAARVNQRKSLILQAQVATRARVSLTTRALRFIASALTGVPGRKNLLWVSASFPLVGLQLDRTDLAAMNFETAIVKDLEETANSLTDARVAVYPVDARGLVNQSVGAANGLAREMPRGAEFADQIARSSTDLFETQAGMAQLAHDTGGVAYYNRNDIGHAAALGASDASSSYYVLGYYPSDKQWNGKFRNIQLEMKRPGVKVRYRQGYYALKTGGALPEKKNSDAWLMEALLPSSPPESGVVFDARVTTTPTEGETQVQVGFRVNFNTLAPQRTLAGERSYALEFHVVAVSPNGEMVSQRDFSVNANLKPETFASIEQQGFPFHTELSLAPGRYQLDLVVRDSRSGNLGTAHVPLILEDTSRSRKTSAKNAS